MLIGRLATAVFSGALLLGGQTLVVTSAADFGEGLPPEGSIASLFCTGLQGLVQSASAEKLPLPIELIGLRVTIGGRPARLFSVNTLREGVAQINVQVPLDLKTDGDKVLITVSLESTSLTANAIFRRGSPGEFFRFPTGDGIFQKAQNGYSLVDAGSPAKGGDILVAYLTGLPTAFPRTEDGVPASGDALSMVPQYATPAGVEEFRIVVASVVVSPSFVGSVPGLVGVFQINFVYPQTGIAGRVPVVLQRRSCRAIAGSCLNGGGSTSITRSSDVFLFGS
jgi:uncharacterized protein (TIGR03437 family)